MCDGPVGDREGDRISDCLHGIRDVRLTRRSPIDLRHIALQRGRNRARKRKRETEIEIKTGIDHAREHDDSIEEEVECAEGQDA